MKNFVKLFGIIAVTAVIGLTLAGCGEKDKFLKVVNQNDTPIAKVSAGLDGMVWKNLNITKGNSQTFTLEGLHDDDREIEVEFGAQAVRKRFDFAEGKTTTVTLTANGQLE